MDLGMKKVAWDSAIPAILRAIADITDANIDASMSTDEIYVDIATLEEVMRKLKGRCDPREVKAIIAGIHSAQFPPIPPPGRNVT